MLQVRFPHASGGDYDFSDVMLREGAMLHAEGSMHEGAPLFDMLPAAGSMAPSIVMRSNAR